MKNLLLSPISSFLPFRSLALLSAISLWLAPETIAQSSIPSDTPQIRLIPVHQREVSNHYINIERTSKGWKLEAYDGARESVWTYSPEKEVFVSPNQRYFTVAKPIAGATGGTIAYEVELRDLSNTLLAKGELASLGSDREETHDEFLPADDGLGLLQRASLPFSGGLRFVAFKRRTNQLLKLFEVAKKEHSNSRVAYEPAQNMIIATFEGQAAGTKDYQTFVQCYALNGALQWETALDSQTVKSDLFLSAFDGTVSFVCRDMRDSSLKNLFLYGKNGNLVSQIPVYRGGIYQRSYYHQNGNGRQYLLSPSDGSFYYVIDPSNGAILNRHTQGKEEAFVTGLAMHQQYLLSSYFTGHFQPGPSNTNEFMLTERGLGVQDINGAVTYRPLQLTGEPYLISIESGLFLREKMGSGAEEKSRFYRVELR